jgi:uncharacterized protein YndB with AHSA1/START domain
VNHQSIIIERTLDTPISKVWQALTDNDEMKKWYFVLPEFKAEVGFFFEFEGGKDPENPYLHYCEVTEVIVGKKITYSWRYDGYEGNSFVTFELFDEGDKTLLTLTHVGLETFAHLNPDFAKENFEEGWTGILDTSLKNYLITSK